MRSRSELGPSEHFAPRGDPKAVASTGPDRGALSKECIDGSSRGADTSWRRLPRSLDRIAGPRMDRPVRLHLRGPRAEDRAVDVCPACQHLPGDPADVITPRPAVLIAVDQFAGPIGQAVRPASKDDEPIGAVEVQSGLGVHHHDLGARVVDDRLDRDGRIRSSARTRVPDDVVGPVAARQSSASR